MCASVRVCVWPMLALALPTDAFYGHAERQALRPQLGRLAPSTSFILLSLFPPLLLFSFISDFALETLVDVFAQLSIIIQNIQVSFMCVHSSLVNPFGGRSRWAEQG